MADAGDGFALKTGSGGEQGAGRCEENLCPFSGSHAGQEIAVQNGGAAAAPGGTAVHILPREIVEEHSAVQISLPQPNAVPGEEIGHDLMAQFSKIACQDQIIVTGGGTGIPEKG